MTFTARGYYTASLTKRSTCLCTVKTFLRFFFYHFRRWTLTSHSNSMPRRHFCPERTRHRLERFLQAKCIICLCLPCKFPSKWLSCCRKQIHEESLWAVFTFFSTFYFNLMKLCYIALLITPIMTGINNLCPVIIMK